MAKDDEEEEENLEEELEELEEEFGEGEDGESEFEGPILGPSPVSELEESIEEILGISLPRSGGRGSEETEVARGEEEKAMYAGQEVDAKYANQGEVLYGISGNVQYSEGESYSHDYTPGQSQGRAPEFVSPVEQELRTINPSLHEEEIAKEIARHNEMQYANRQQDFTHVRKPLEFEAAGIQPAEFYMGTSQFEREKKKSTR